MKQCVKLHIHGRVQGVYFRKFTHHKANQLGVTGWVKNLPDGSVEALAQAEEAILQEFIDWCHKGPITARVDRVDVITLAPNEDLITFFIK